ncbi:MAG TPA: hypothetical protein VFF00_02610 [Candidatus Elarobacter sp.]|nr:hypothetical protein [Candidatus Elarobacter sp.]
MRRGEAWALVDALAACAPRFGTEARPEKLRLLARLATVQIASAPTLERLHESLCFVRAYPDDAAVQDAAERALREFAMRVRRLAAPARARLHDSGIADTDLDYPFGLPMARWLATRFPGDVTILWRTFDGGERLEEALSLLVTPTEAEAFTEGGLGWRRWLRLASGGRASDLEVLLRLFRTAPISEEAREWLFETLELPIVWRLRGAAPSRTLLRLPGAPVFYQREGLRRSGVDFAREITRPLPTLRQADRAVADAVMEAARAAMATRARELHAFARPNAGDILVADPGRGLRIALVGLRPDDRLPLDAYYAYLAFKNGVPVSYGGGWGCFGTLEFALNIFESFRQGESALLISQILRVYYRVFRMRTVVVDRSQIDDSNPEGLRTGAFYFYAKLGFRPTDAEVSRLADAERARIARERDYRSPLAMLRRLGRSNLFLTLDGGPPAPAVTGSRLAALVTGHITRVFDGDRRAAVADAVTRVARALGATGWRRVSPPERRAFERLAIVMGLIPDLARWPARERERLRRVMRAKGGVSEARYLALLDDHRRLRRSLDVLVRGAPVP